MATYGKCEAQHCLAFGVGEQRADLGRGALVRRGDGFQHGGAEVDAAQGREGLVLPGPETAVTRRARPCKRTIQNRFKRETLTVRNLAGRARTLLLVSTLLTNKPCLYLKNVLRNLAGLARTILTQHTSNL